MRVIIAGSRGIEDGGLVAAAIAASGFDVTEVVSGTCHGVDRLGEIWGSTRGLPVVRFPADWRRLGKKAGPMRNVQMVNHAAAAGGGLVAIWNGVSRGTRHTIEYARQQGLAVYVHLM